MIHHVRSLLDKMMLELKILFGHKAERKKQNDLKRKEVRNRVTLTKEQKNQIDTFFKDNYGKKIGYVWHQIYYSISGKFDFQYFPELLYTPDLQNLYNSPYYCKSLADKNIINLLIDGSNLDIKTIPTIVHCSNGMMFDKDHKRITLDQAISILLQKSFFIKPSIDSNSGNGCEIFYINSPSHTFEAIKKTLVDHGKDFVVQEIIKNQKDLSKLNASSLNTFRLITYQVGDVIKASPITLRVGTKNNFCDNAHAGGLFVAVSDDGTIISDGKTEFGENLDRHPDSNIQFVGYKISNVHKLKESAIKAAGLFPHVGVIDWDLTLDQNNDVVVVEANMFGGSIWLIQMAHGKSAFGDDTALLLQSIRKMRKHF